MSVWPPVCGVYLTTGLSRPRLVHHILPHAADRPPINPRSIGGRIAPPISPRITSNRPLRPLTCTPTVQAPSSFWGGRGAPPWGQPKRFLIQVSLPPPGHELAPRYTHGGCPVASKFNPFRCSVPVSRYPDGDYIYDYGEERAKISLPG